MISGRPILLDSSVYVKALRRGDGVVPSARTFDPAAHLWLSAVVLEELYAGAGEKDRPLIERLNRDFTNAGRILVPSLTDWVWTGRVLARLGARYGYEHIGRGRLTNDALIAMSAGRQGIVVLTSNARDFARLAEFRPFQWEIFPG